MIEVILCVGIPGSGKSTWAKEIHDKDPKNWKLLSRDDLRLTLDNSHFSNENEKFISHIRKIILTEVIKSNKNIILHDTNLDKNIFIQVCEIVDNLNLDCEISEKSFFVDFNEAVKRDSQRIGKAKVGEKVILNFWKKSGGYRHQYYIERKKIFKRKNLFNFYFRKLIKLCQNVMKK